MGRKTRMKTKKLKSLGTAKIMQKLRLLSLDDALMPAITKTYNLQFQAPCGKLDCAASTKP